MIQLRVGMNGTNTSTDLLIRHIQPIEMIPSIRAGFAANQLNSSEFIPVLIRKLSKADGFRIIILPAIIMWFHDIENVTVGVGANDNKIRIHG